MVVVDGHSPVGTATPVARVVTVMLSARASDGVVFAKRRQCIFVLFDVGKNLSDGDRVCCSLRDVDRRRRL